MQHALAKAKALGHSFVILIGDEPYYARVGFQKTERGSIQLPGPVDPARILIADLTDDLKEQPKGRVTVPRDTNR